MLTCFFWVWRWMYGLPTKRSDPWLDILVPGFWFLVASPSRTQTVRYRPLHFYDRYIRICCLFLHYCGCYFCNSPFPFDRRCCMIQWYLVNSRLDYPLQPHQSSSSSDARFTPGSNLWTEGSVERGIIWMSVFNSLVRISYIQCCVYSMWLIPFELRANRMQHASHPTPNSKYEYKEANTSPSTQTHTQMHARTQLREPSNAICIQPGFVLLVTVCDCE